MTPKMVRALADAAAAIHHRGLERTVAGWRSTHPQAGCLDYHAFATIHALVRAGHLDLWNNGKVAHVTDGGTAALARWQERAAAAAEAREAAGMGQ